MHRSRRRLRPLNCYVTNLTTIWLLAVLGSKKMTMLPVKVQRFPLKVMAYTYSLVYTSGKHWYWQMLYQDRWTKVRL